MRRGCTHNGGACRTARAPPKRHGGPSVSADHGVSECGICSSSEYCEALPPVPLMKLIVGKPYQVAPNWYMVLKSAKRTIIIGDRPAENS